MLKKDSFLTGHLKRPSYSLAQGSCTSDDFSAEFHAALENQEAFVTGKVSCKNVAAAAKLCAAGFYPADVNLTLEAPLADIRGNADVARPAKPGDRSDVLALAGKSFTCSRFHRDPNIPEAIAHKIKRAWADNFFQGQRGDSLIVAKAQGKVAGFLLLLHHENILTIDLIAVDEAWRRHGLAQSMIARSVKEFPHVKTIRAGTQAANISSLRFYRKLGYQPTDSTMVFHYWKDK